MDACDRCAANDKPGNGTVSCPACGDTGGLCGDPTCCTCHCQPDD
jgi:hypothetical protein